MASRSGVPAARDRDATPIRSCAAGLRRSCRRATRSFTDLPSRNISIPARSPPAPGRSARSARNACSAFSRRCEKLMKIPVGRLSGGERRMVSIGRGLMADAKLFLVDEPSLGLAPKIGIAVIEALMAVDLGQSAMVIAEQNVALLEGRVDRIIGMHAGKLKGEASFVPAFKSGSGRDELELRHLQCHHAGRASTARSRSGCRDHLVEPRAGQSWPMASSSPSPAMAPGWSA